MEGLSKNRQSSLSILKDGELEGILQKYSTQCFSIEYGGFLSNHVSHGIIALARLGATRERIEQFVEWYRSRLEKPEQNPKELILPENQKEATSETLKNLLGKRCSFYPILQHYKKSYQEDCDGSMDLFISKHLPHMFEGLQGSALHGLIHLGYGYSARCPAVVTEGVAYLHHSYRSFPIPQDNTFGKGSCSAIDVLEKIRKDDKLCSFENLDQEELKVIPSDWFTSDVQKRLAILSAPRRSRQVVYYADQIQLPAWLNLAQVSHADILRLCDWIIDTAITVYTVAEGRNDFFLLHGVTGAWSLKQVLSAMVDIDVKVLLLCVQEFIYVLCCVYIAQKRPKLMMKYIEEGSGIEESWENIIQDALKSQKDEHIYKLVQVCFERAQTLGHDEQGMYKLAARSSLQFDFTF